jgi:hypothetical protein
MDHSARCPHCRESIEYTTEMAGNLMLCPHCQKRFRLAPVKTPEPAVEAAIVAAPSIRTGPSVRRQMPQFWGLWALVGTVVVASIGLACVAAVIAFRPRPQQTPGTLVPAQPRLTRNETEAIIRARNGTAYLDPGTMTTGDVGVFVTPVLVNQIQDSESFLGVVGGYTVLFTGVDTRDSADGREWPLGQWYEVIGQTRYVTVTGGKRTVMTVRWFDHSRVIDEIANAIAQRVIEQTQKSAAP